MSIALQWGYSSKVPSKSKGFLYFDAVTSLTEQYSGQVTKNPIDGGGSITDHFTRNNPIITVSAVLSGVDISVKGVDITDNSIKGEKPTNDKSQRPLRYTPTQVKNPQKNALIGLLPDVVGRFFKPTRPDINMAAQTPDTLRAMKDLLIGLFSDNGVTLVTLYQYDGNNLRKPAISNLVMTGLTFKETPETGDGLFCDFTLEQVSFVSVKKSPLPQDIKIAAQVSADIQARAEGNSPEGKKDSTVIDNRTALAQLSDAADRALSRVFGGGSE